jgi:hypothetical protein
MNRILNTAWSSIIGLGLVYLGACLPPSDFDTTSAVQYGTFGEEVFQILRDEARLAKYEPAVKVATLDTNAVDLIWALNHAVDGDVGDRLARGLKSIIHLYDDNSDGSPAQIPELTRILAQTLEAALERPGLLTALAELDQAFDPVPPALFRFMNRTLRNPVRILRRMSEFLIAREPMLIDLQADLYSKISNESETTSSSPTGALQELLIPLPFQGPDLGPPAWAVAVDDTGAPVVHVENGVVPAPFADINQDGLPDRNPDGSLITLPPGTKVPPAFSWTGHSGELRDVDGRAVSASSSLLYNYRDLRQTPLSFALAVAKRYIEQSALQEASRAAWPFLGPLTSTQDAIGLYLQHSPEGAPIDWWLAALTASLDYERLPQVLEALIQLDLADPTLFKRLLEDAGTIRSIFGGTRYLKPGNVFIDDLLRQFAFLAENQLFSAMFEALADPRSMSLKTGLPLMFQYADLQFPEDLGTLQTPSDVDNLTYGPLVDHTQSDVDPANQSMMQRGLELISDTNNVPFSVSVLDFRIEDLVITDNLAALYLDSMADNAQLSIAGIPDSVVEQLLALIPEFDDLSPTAEQMNLFLAHDQILIGNPVCKRGFEVRNHHGVMLLAFQKTGALESLSPIAEVYASVNRADAYADLMEMNFLHYATFVNNTGVATTFGTGLRNAEPDLIELLSQTRLVNDIHDLAIKTAEISFQYKGQTLNARQELALFLSHLLQPDLSLASRAPGPLLRGDGAALDPADLSPMMFLVQASRRSDDALASDIVATQAWENVALAGTLLDMNGEQLSNPHTVPFVRGLLHALNSYLQASYLDAPTWRLDLEEFRSNILDNVQSRALRTILILLSDLRDDAAFSQDVSLFLANTLSHEVPTPGEDGHAAMLQVLSWLSETKIESAPSNELLNWLKQNMKPEDRIPIRLIQSLASILEADEQSDLVASMIQSTSEPLATRIPARIFADAVKQITRLQPGTTGPYTDDDVRFIMENLHDYLLDDQRGLERMYEIIRNRK